MTLMVYKTMQTLGCGQYHIEGNQEEDEKMDSRPLTLAMKVSWCW
jgi:hypothetical protein